MLVFCIPQPANFPAHWLANSTFNNTLLAQTQTCLGSRWSHSPESVSADAGCRNIASTFNRLHTAITGESIGKTWVSEVIRSHRYDIDDLRRRFKHKIPRPIAPNVVWGLDLTGKTDIGGNQHAILGIIDHGSRMVVFLRTVTRQTTWSLLGYLFLAIGQYGKPRSVRTDNGAALVSRRFTTVLAMLGIRHQKTDSATASASWRGNAIRMLAGHQSLPASTTSGRMVRGLGWVA